ncbi:ATP-binding protein [Streptomyces narbonensis]
MHCIWEIIDNSVDEALGGYCDHIEVILHDNGSVEVRDNGRGIPVDVEPKTGLSGVEVVMTKLHAGGKFGGGSYAASGGLHGVGASVVNALSARLERRGRPEQLHALHQLPPRRARHLHGAGPRQPLRPRQRPAEGQARPQDAYGHARPLLGGPADLPQGRQALAGDAPPARPADRLPRARPHDRRPRRAGPGRDRQERGDLPLRRRHQRVLRVPRAGQGRL